LLEKGVSFINQPHVVAKMGNTERWMTFFKETEGNTHFNVRSTNLIRMSSLSNYRGALLEDHKVAYQLNIQTVVSLFPKIIL